MKILHYLQIMAFSATMISTFILCSGCAKTHSSTTQRILHTLPPPVSTMNHKPSWLVIANKAENIQGDKIKVKGNLKGIGGFDLVSTSTNPELTVTFLGGGQIAYWEGSGSITKISTGQRIIVPVK